MSKFIKLSSFQLNAPLDSEEVGEELSKLGNFTPIDVLDIAKSPRSSLHKYFEWDDSKAAHAYRLSQARHLVLSIGFESNGNQMRAFESVVIDDSRVYMATQNIANNQSLVEQVLKSALRELLFWKTKHQRYQSFFGDLFDVITKAEEAYRSRSNEKGKKEAKVRKGKRRVRVKADDTANKKAGRNDHDRRRVSAAR